MEPWVVGVDGGGGGGGDDGIGAVVTGLVRPGGLNPSEGIVDRIREVSMLHDTPNGRNTKPKINK